MTAASNERKRFLSWPRPVCQEPFTRTFAAAPMFHAIWIIIYPVTTSRARRDCRTPSQKPREKKKDSNKLVGSGSFISEQGKSYANMCRFEQKISNYYSELCHLCSSSICFIIVPFLSSSSSSSSSVFVCVCVCVFLLFCFGVRWEIFIGVDGFRAEVRTNCSNLRYPYYRGRWFGITDSCIKGAFSSYINMLVMGK